MKNWKKKKKQQKKPCIYACGDLWTMKEVLQIWKQEKFQFSKQNKKIDFRDYCCCCLVTKLCPTVCDFMDCILPGSSVHGISQARKLDVGSRGILTEYCIDGS